MCHICANAFRKYFPHLTTEQQIDLLWCGTCYPAGDADQVEKQVEELARKSGAEYEVARDIVHREFDEVWERTRPEREKQQQEEEAEWEASIKRQQEIEEEGIRHCKSEKRVVLEAP